MTIKISHTTQVNIVEDSDEDSLVMTNLTISDKHTGTANSTPDKQ